MIIDLIKYPIKVDKYEVKQLKNGNQVYTFKLDVRLTKPQIKKIFETLFHIQVLSVNTVITRKKRSRQNYKPRFKKAILTVPATVGPMLFANLKTKKQKTSAENTELLINTDTDSKSTISSTINSESISKSEINSETTSKPTPKL
jgi:ribosomal protein L23